MLRRAFLAAGAVVGLLPLPAIAARTHPGGVRLLRVRISGAAYGGAAGVVASLIPGEPAQLRRVPDNRFDGNTVEVIAGGAILGTVPGVQAALLAPLIDVGVPVFARIAKAHAFSGRPLIEIDLLL